jgi:hypothetical protein
MRAPPIGLLFALVLVGIDHKSRAANSGKRSFIVHFIDIAGNADGADHLAGWIQNQLSSAFLAALVSERRSSVPFYVNTARETAASVSPAVEAITRFGGTVVTDTCTYITPIIGDVQGVVMTNSGKWAYYAPGNLGVDVAIGSLADCVESAVLGRVVARGLGE